MKLKIGIIICDNAPKWQPLLEPIVKRCFYREGDEIRYFRAIDGDMPNLENTADLDAMICLGSAKSAYENEPWMLQLCEFFKSVASTKLKLYGSCFGHQLINRAFGGEVAKNAERGFVFGADEIKINIPEDLADTDLTKILQNGSSLKVLNSHGDEVVSLGDGARLLGSSARCKNEIVLVRDNILTMQCHPDLTPELMMMNIWPALTGKGAIDPADKEKIEEELVDLDTDKCLDILRAFLESPGSLGIQPK
ncbi:hypothetical protein ACHWQZ_G008107 [Mnemiopsis leidyi]